MPVYNEAEGIGEFHKALTNVLIKIQSLYTFEIIYVVDKCTDNSLELLTKISQKSNNVIVLGLSRRFGHQMSLIAGIDNCSGDAAIMMDCDLEHPPELIPILLDRYEKGYEIVKTQRIYDKNVSRLKMNTSKLYYKFLNYLTEEELGENEADFRLISKKVIDVFKNNIREHNQYLRGLITWVGFNQTIVVFESTKRKLGKGKYNLKRLISFGLQGVVSFSKIPLKLTILIGFLIAIVGIIYGGVIAIQRLINPSVAPAGWISIIVLMLVLGGVQLIALGVIGEYIGTIIDEVKNRPLYIIENHIGKK